MVDACAHAVLRRCVSAVDMVRTGFAVISLEPTMSRIADIGVYLV
jgi:hypothetical protein